MRAKAHSAVGKLARLVGIEFIQAFEGTKTI
jgi:hypothetical protein